MKYFLTSDICDTTSQIVRHLVVMGLLVTVSACSTGGNNNGYYEQKTQNMRNNDAIKVVYAGETAVINELGSRKVRSPNFLVNDPYTSLSPDEIIRRYSSSK